MWRTLTALAALTLMACSSGNSDSGPETVGAAVGNASVTAADVTAAVEAAGLPVVNPRDNTTGWCDPDNPDMVPCTEMLTTDLFTVRVWETPQDAKKWIDLSPADPPMLLGDLTTVDFHEGGSTPTYDRAAYEAAVATLNT